MAEVDNAALQSEVVVDGDLRDAIALYEQYVQVARTAVSAIGTQSLPRFFAPTPVPNAMSLVES